MKPMNIKQKLHDQCLILVKERIATAQAAMDAAYESMLNETKSSAGDKFETSRAMLQAEQDRMKAVIIKSKALEQQLKNIDLNVSENIQAGSLVFTSGLDYYISIGLGKMRLEKETYYTISSISPIGQLLIGKRAGEEVSFNGKTFTIERVL